MGLENYQEFRQAIHDETTVRAILEDYNVGLCVDRRLGLGSVLSSPASHARSAGSNRCYGSR